jgi:hypothetical protein
MDLVELKEKIRASKLHPIQVEDSIDPDDAEGLSFVGSLEEYLESVSVLDEKAIFIATEELTEENFVYELKSRSFEDDEDGVQFEEFELCEINPALKRFKAKIGEIGAFRLFSSLSKDNLNFYIIENWWEEYVAESVEIVEQIKADKQEAYERIKEGKKEKNDALVKAIRSLIKNEDFCKLSTQRAMINYANENIPDLDELEPKVFKLEIQKLYDKLKG